MSREAFLRRLAKLPKGMPKDYMPMFRRDGDMTVAYDFVSPGVEVCIGVVGEATPRQREDMRHPIWNSLQHHRARPHHA